jgi:hypothetical protein
VGKKTRWLFALSLVIGVVARAADTPITFHKDVLPILQKNCHSCHRPGQIAPMSLLDYKSSRPWAKAMKAAVLTKKMPPWFADPKYGHWANDRRLKQSEIDTIAQWADGGALEGEAKDAPAPIAWPPDAWNIQPDYVVQGPSYTVPANPKNDVIEWITVVTPGGFTKDTWVSALQIRPMDLAVTHHVCLSFIPHSEKTKYNQPVWTDKKRDEKGQALPGQETFSTERRGPRQIQGPAVEGGTAGGAEAAAALGESAGCWVPGAGTWDYAMFNAGRLMPANTDFVWSLHFTPVGKEVATHVEVAFTIAKEEPQRKFVFLASTSPTDEKHFAIPPGDPNWQSPPAIADFLVDAEIVELMPHMHVRGKDMDISAEYPTGERQTLLSVPHYDFNWQLAYRPAVPIKVPKGSKLIGNAHFDNSPNNKFNPDPSATVYYGDMTFEEMMMPFFAVTVDKNVPSSKILAGPAAPGGA